jgi:hypothetical protein
MSLFEHSRQRVTTQLQHPLKHSLKDFLFTHDVLPSTVTNLEQSITWLFDALYPKTKASVADVPSLPAVGNTLGDQRLVQDDGDGKAALYKWEQHDGEATPSWHKIMDVDWSSDVILSELIDKTLPSFVIKKGASDIDEAGSVIAGLLAGQSIYGGLLANTNLTLFANNGDAVGNTGFIQLGDHTSPLIDSTFNLGESARRFLNVYTDSLSSGTLVATSGSITDSSGAITFDNENLTTTGTLASGVITVSSDMVIGSGSITSVSGSITFADENLTTTGTLAAGTATILSDLVLGVGSITSVSGNISFGNENLTTTGTLGAGDTTVTLLNVDQLRIDGNTIQTLSGNADITLNPHGTGKIYLTKITDTLGIDTLGNHNITGNVDATGYVSGGDLTMSTNVFSSSTDMTIQATGGDVFLSTDTKSTVDATTILGDATHRFKDIFLSGTVDNGTNAITMADLLSLRSVQHRDAGRTLPAQAGDSLFYDGAQWLASVPDTEVVHKNLTLDVLTDDGHTQFAMLGGRVGGQTINGGTLTTNTLLLRNNVIDGNGFDVEATKIKPTENNSQDIGDSTHRIKDLYMGGQFVGGRVQNLLEVAITDLSASSKGRLFYSTDTKAVWVDTGGAKKRVGQNTYIATHTAAVVNGGAIDVTTGTEIVDASNCLWQLRDAATGENIYAPMTLSSTHVTITASPALPAGNYKLIGIEA